MHNCDYTFGTKPASLGAWTETLHLDMAGALSFHQNLRDYAPTSLVELPVLASELGVGALFLKDESSRFGLNAFKGLGASFAVHRYLQENPSTGEITFCTATDGNHGRAVAWTAKTLGHHAVIYVPANTVQARIENIRKEGAEVVVVQGHYDAATRAAESAARTNAWVMVQDSAWDGYTTIPTWIMAGYTTHFQELESQPLPAPLHSADKPSIDLVLVHAGVGSWAAAAVWYYVKKYGVFAPKFICVEPLDADCCLESAKQGTLSESKGSQNSIMAGLNCGTPSTIAWEVLYDTIDCFLAIPDEYSLAAMRKLYFPQKNTSKKSDPRIIAGESGAAGLAGLIALQSAPELAPVRERLGISTNTRVLVFSTEGATNPEYFASVMEYGV